jgi:hypothetical protein
VLLCRCRAYIDTCDELLGFNTARKTPTADAPVEVSEQYHRRFKALMDLVLLNEAGPLGKVTEHFWRLEYQQLTVLADTVALKYCSIVLYLYLTSTVFCSSVVLHTCTCCCGLMAPQ